MTTNGATATASPTSSNTSSNAESNSSTSFSHGESSLTRRFLWHFCSENYARTPACPSAFNVAPNLLSPREARHLLPPRRGGTRIAPDKAAPAAATRGNGDLIYHPPFRARQRMGGGK